jgi:hypothetical protein
VFFDIFYILCGETEEKETKEKGVNQDDYKEKRVAANRHGKNWNSWNNLCRET